MTKTTKLSTGSALLALVFSAGLAVAAGEAKPDVPKLKGPIAELPDVLVFSNADAEPTLWRDGALDVGG